MVNGIEKFIEKFKDYPNCYTVIGGSACDILMSEANLTFRATKDIDMILVVENQTSEFGKQFWEYIKEGGYQWYGKMMKICIFIDLPIHYLDIHT